MAENLSSLSELRRGTQKAKGRGQKPDGPKLKAEMRGIGCGKWA